MASDVAFPRMAFGLHRWVLVALGALVGSIPLACQANAQLIAFTVDPGPPPPPKVWQLSAKPSLVPVGSELCGIDSIFLNGYESTVPPLTSYPGAFVSPGAATSIMGSVTVSITYPGNGATLYGPTTEVAGTFSGPADTGIVVNGVVAYTDGGNFLAPAVPLQTGQITASATTLTGATNSAFVNVTQGSATPPVVTLSVARPVNYAPFLVTFSPNIGPLPGGASVQSYTIDYNGDNINDGTALTYLATQSNLYTARLTVTDSNNATYTAYARYLVEDLKRQTGTLCDVYGYLRQRLSAQDTSGALTAIDPTAQDEYQAFFTANAASLPSYVTTLGSIVDGYITGRTATFFVVRENGDLTLSGYHIEFSQGADGTWRITKM